MSNDFSRICVFCGSKPGARPAYLECARRLGRELASRKIGVVYGGASVGMMGALADAALAAGGEVIGVIPHGLAAREVAHDRLTRMHVVDSMHERKALMEQLSDGFIAMPGGFGTLEELLEIVTWTQLGLHRKPTGLLNVSGFFAPLLAQIQRGLEEGFIPPQLATVLVAEEDPARLVSALIDHEPPPPTVKWISRGEI